MSRDASDSLLEVPGAIQDVLATVRENLKRLEDAMVEKPAFSKAHSEAAGKLASAVKTLSAEARLWTEQLGERAKRATPEQRTTACIEFLASLPDGVRWTAYKRLTELEATRLGAAIKLELGENPR